MSAFIATPESNLLSALAHCYFFLALAYNVSSQVSLDVTGRKLTPTDPVFGIVFIAVVYFLFLLKPYLPTYPFIVLGTVFLASILRFGIIKHLLNFSPDTYYSRFSWFLAILINLFGCIVLFLVFFMTSEYPLPVEK